MSVTLCFYPVQVLIFQDTLVSYLRNMPITFNRTLYISGNPIASEGAAAFAGVLKRNQCLKILWLDGAIGSVESSLQLIKSLRHNGTLEKLWLSDEHKPPSFSTLDKALQDRVNFI